MKKYIVLVFMLSIVVTGCFGERGAGKLYTKCYKEINTSYLKETDTYDIYYREGDVFDIIITKKYDGMDMKNEINTYKKMYESDAINITTTDNSITYNFDLSLISDDIKDTFNIKYRYNDEIKKLKELGFTCE